MRNSTDPSGGASLAKRSVSDLIGENGKRFFRIRYFAMEEHAHEVRRSGACRLIEPGISVSVWEDVIRLKLNWVISIAELRKC